MPSIGPLEVIVVLLIALLVFGPKRLPELGRSLGHGISEFRNSVSSRDDVTEVAEETPSTKSESLDED